MSLEMAPSVEESDVLGINGGEFGLRSTLDACVKCTICETQCPVMRVTDLFAGPKYSGPQSERYRKDGHIVDHSIDYCSSCGTCSLVCPQGVKVTEMIHHARTDMKKKQGIPLRDQLIGRTGLIGSVMTPFAPIANWALDVKPIRVAMEKVIGVDRNAPMPRAYGRTFESWFKKHTPLPESGTKGQVIFFHGCAGQYFEVETSIHSVLVLEHLGYEVLGPAPRLLWSGSSVQWPLRRIAKVCLAPDERLAQGKPRCADHFLLRFLWWHAPSRSSRYFGNGYPRASRCCLTYLGYLRVPY